jgi:hypothetical protein
MRVIQKVGTVKLKYFILHHYYIPYIIFLHNPHDKILYASII